MVEKDAGVAAAVHQRQFTLKTKNAFKVNKP